MTVPVLAIIWTLFSALFLWGMASEIRRDWLYKALLHAPNRRHAYAWSVLVSLVYGLVITGVIWGVSALS